MLSANVPTIRSIPWRLRPLFKEVLASALSRAVTSNSLAAWTRLFLLPKAVLCVPRGNPRGKSLANAVERRLTEWQLGNLPQLWASTPHRPFPSRSDVSPNPDLQSHLACLSVQGGNLRGACARLTSKGLAPPGPATSAALRALFPSGPNVTPLLPPDDEPLRPSPQDVEKALLSFSRASAGGPSGLRPSHLLATHAVSGGTPILPLLTDLVFLWLSGRLPPRVARLVTCANLVAFRKQSSGIRPIAIGEVFRRLVGKVSAKAYEGVARSAYPQLGVGVKGGAEVAVHATRSFLYANPDTVGLQVDFTNAFGRVDRSTVLSVAKSQCPAIFRWVATCYSAPSTLFYRGTRIPCTLGVHQGDPLSPLLFCLVLGRLVSRLLPLNPSLHWWYLDDGLIAGSPEVVEKAAAILAAHGPPLGLHLNATKSLVIAAPSTSLPPGLSAFPRASPTSIEALGAPIGTEAHAREVVSGKIMAVLPLLTAIGRLPDAHSAYTLLRTCGGYSKMSYLTRVVPPFQGDTPFTVFDDGVRDALSCIVGSTVGPVHGLLASLPTRCGGLGLLSTSLLSPAAYASSLSFALPKAKTLLPPSAAPLPSLLAPALHALRASLPGADLPAFTVPTAQSSVSRLLHSNLLKQIVSRDLRTKVVLQCSASRHAGAWLSALPTPSHHISNRTFPLLLRLRLCMPLFPPGATCPSCDGPLDPLGDHALKCRSGGCLIQRHNATVLAWARCFRLCGLSIRREVGARPSSSSRPGDLQVSGLGEGLQRLCDVVITHPGAGTALKRAASSLGGHLRAAELGKCAKYRDTFNGSSRFRVGLQDFVPLAHDSFGGWGNTALRILAECTPRLARLADISASEATARFTRLVSTALMREVGRSLLRRVTTRHDVW